VLVHAVVVVPPSPDVGTPLAGVPVVVRSVQAMLGVPGIRRVEVLAPRSLVSEVDALCSGLPVAVHDSVTALSAVPGITASRAHAGQRPDGSEGDGSTTLGSCVLVHDAARPLVPVATVQSVVDAVCAGYRAVVPVLPLADTVKEVGPDGLLRATPDRSGLRVVQAPQGFDGSLLAAVLDAARPDPVRAWTGAGEKVHTVPGHPLAFAVADDWDRALAERAVRG
jgi:2-C-methyl-D-erythritol 4-phosphate cytidylyltransferase